MDASSATRDSTHFTDLHFHTRNRLESTAVLTTFFSALEEKNSRLAQENAKKHSRVVLLGGTRGGKTVIFPATSVRTEDARKTRSPRCPRWQHPERVSFFPLRKSSRKVARSCFPSLSTLFPREILIARLHGKHQSNEIWIGKPEYSHKAPPLRGCFN